jgi:hypothetical protein
MGKDKDDRIAVKEGGMKRDKQTIDAFAIDRRGMLGLASGLILASGAAFADPVGPVTKLPLPRFASLKTDRVNLREGPSKDHATKWVYQRAGLPVEITAEQKGRERAALRPRLRISRPGRDASVRRDRQHPQLQRRLVPCRWRRVQGIYRAGEIVGRLPRRKGSLRRSASAGRRLEAALSNTTASAPSYD